MYFSTFFIFFNLCSSYTKDFGLGNARSTLSAESSSCQTRSSAHSYSDWAADLNNYIGGGCFLLFYNTSETDFILLMYHYISLLCPWPWRIIVIQRSTEVVFSPFPQLCTLEVTRKSKQSYFSFSVWRKNISSFYGLQYILWEPLFFMHQHLHCGREQLGKQ